MRLGLLYIIQSFGVTFTFTYNGEVVSPRYRYQLGNSLLPNCGILPEHIPLTNVFKITKTSNPTNPRLFTPPRMPARL